MVAGCAPGVRTIAKRVRFHCKTGFMACVAVPGGIGCPRSDEAPYDLVTGSAKPAHRSASVINAFVSDTFRLDGRCGDGKLVFSTAAPGPGAAGLRAAMKGVRAQKARHFVQGVFIARCFLPSRCNHAYRRRSEFIPNRDGSREAAAAVSWSCGLHRPGALTADVSQALTFGDQSRAQSRS